MSEHPLTPPAEAKERLRRQALTRRAALTGVDRAEASLKLADFATDLELPAAVAVAGFWPIRDEIDPRPLLVKLRDMGHPLCLPAVIHPTLIFRSFGRDTKFVPGGFGTMAPCPDAEELRPDVLLMPLAAFDSRGNRIGYGKGHYDRAIAVLEKEAPVVCIGLAFDVQEVGEVPAEAHDRRLDALLTPTGLRRF
ncbi:5-formyltetrahydrofolate cyclo-ligase [Roseibium litorale]|uniref:5-formyltetrahydrofolate cyclo-ligase n=1 Tax=Roseibium litorale TaxID=2803841 RepID=A0ABR9CSP1_9HYPH|nr:5-formyltetrahydrofolate cyclo-ligase [Roseibium litorale]MBD8893713.1 5-formyltetrahydrofolate cyclo-ligase [Roseibium litorale]